MQLPGHQHAAATLVLLQVESLAASRQSGASSEPADSVRAVNALLTQLDALKGHANVMVRSHTAGLAQDKLCTLGCTTIAHALTFDEIQPKLCKLLPLHAIT